MRSRAKIVHLAAICGFLFLFWLPSTGLASEPDREYQISQDLKSAGYKVEEITQAKIPMSQETYYIAIVNKDGESQKVKVFKDKYFISGEHGRLTPIEIFSKRPFGSKSKQRAPSQEKPKGFTHLSRPNLDNDVEARRAEPWGEEQAPKKTPPAARSYSGFLSAAEPRVNLANERSVASAASSIRNGCMPSTFSRITDFAMNMKDTSDILQGAQKFRSAGMVSDPSKDFKHSRQDSETEKILASAKSQDGRDTVTNSQSDLEKKVNSDEMHRYSLRMLWESLYGTKESSALSPYQLVVQSNLKRLVTSMQRQGKSKEDIYRTVGVQLKSLYGGKVVLSGVNPKRPWAMRDDGRLEIYSLVNNRDQVLSYSIRALTLENDPMYQAKKSDRIRKTRELENLKRNATFESDNARMKGLAERIEKLSRELDIRQKELLD